MGLEYNLLNKQQCDERERDLRGSLSPRNHCRRYVYRHGGKATLLSLEDFESNIQSGKFSDGPFKDTFGDDYGEPYNPNRQAFGKLQDGSVVYRELSKANAERTEELFSSMEQEE